MEKLIELMEKSTNSIEVNVESMESMEMLMLESIEVQPESIEK
jgi:hypothetical protein